MGGQRISSGGRRGWTPRRMVLVAAVVIAATGAAMWWSSRVPDSAAGTPRLVVDRTDVDLGDLRYGSPAHVVFTLTNAGDGFLVVKEAPRVLVKAGC